MGIQIFKARALRQLESCPVAAAQIRDSWGQLLASLGGQRATAPPPTYHTGRDIFICPFVVSQDLLSWVWG